MVGIAVLLEVGEVDSILLPFAVELCRDPIAAVREEAAKQVRRHHGGSRNGS